MTLNIREIGFQPVEVTLRAGSDTPLEEVIAVASDATLRLGFAHPDVLPHIYVFENAGANGRDISFIAVEQSEEYEVPGYVMVRKMRLYLPESLLRQMHPALRATFKPDSRSL